MKYIITFLLLFPLVTIAQICDSPVPQIMVDLSESPIGEFVIGGANLNGDCCGSENLSGNVNCVEFIVIPHPNAFSFSFNLSGGLGNGTLYVDCGEEITNNENFCVFGGDQFSLIFCKPGSNPISGVVISSYGLPNYEFDDITVEETCSVSIISENVSITSISPNTIGFYNNLLSCTTNCDEVIIDTSLLVEYVEFIDFQIVPVYTEFIGNVDFNCDDLINTSDLGILLGLIENNIDTLRVNITPKVELNVISGCDIFSYVVNGGTEPYSFNLNGENVNEIIPVEGINTLIVESSLCSSDTVEFEWYQTKTPIEVFYDENICLGDEIFFTNFNDSDTLVWDFGDGTQFIGIGNVTHSYETFGQFLIEISHLNNNFCDESFIGELNVNPKPNIVSDVTPISGCSPLPVTLFSQFIQGYSYFWDTGITTSVLNEFTTVFDEPNEYTINHIVSNGECNSDTTFNVTVYETPISDFVIDPNVIDELNLSTIGLTNNSQFGSGYFWDFGGGFTSTMFEPNISEISPGEYNISLTVTNDLGCEDISYGKLLIKPMFTFYVPNTITPNNDGVNDVFFGEGIGVKHYEMEIYNRWGEKIFRSENVKDAWNGGVTEWYVQNDVYLYVFKITDVLGRIHLIKGHVTVLR